MASNRTSKPIGMPRNSLDHAIEFHKAGKLAKAEREYKRHLAAEPRDAFALMSLAVLKAQQKDYASALTLFARAEQAAPMVPAIPYNKGRALLEVERHAEAAACFQKTLELAPNTADAHNNLGNAFKALCRRNQAIESHRRAVQINPALADAHYNLGIVFTEIYEPDAAAEAFRHAAALRPHDKDVQYALGQALFSASQHAEAAKCFAAVVASDPLHAGAHSRLVYAKRQICDWDGIVELERALLDLSVRPARDLNTSEVVPFVSLAVTNDAKLLLEVARRNASIIARKIKSPTVKASKRRDDKIRLAYVAGDFRAHATSFLIADLIETHDRSRFDVYGVSFGPDDGSEMRRRMAGAFDHFIEAADLTPQATAQRMRALECDIAVDLVGYNQFQRMEIFAHRPAPIQVSYLGWPGTTGANFFDYILADRFVIPDDHHAFFAEKTVRLPYCYQANDRTRSVSGQVPSRLESGLPEAGLVFCCFNNTYKITPAIFAIWMRLLHAVPESVLWLLQGSDAAVENLRLEAMRRGIDPSRLVFAPIVPYPEYLARHVHADLFLDTLPYNAHTTASDALWSGVPLVTCVGQSFAGRVAGSLLQAVGLPELITSNLVDYEKLALRLATEPALLAAMKDRLRQGRSTARLFDMNALCRHIESAYERMWSLARAGRPPSSFDVAPSE